MATPSVTPERASHLKNYIDREKSEYEKRKLEKKDLSQQLEDISLRQNEVRESISQLVNSEKEFEMALANLRLEQQKQKDLVEFEKKRLRILLQLAYRVKKDGAFRFLVLSRQFQDFGMRLRILYRTIRSRSVLTKQLEERIKRFDQNEKKVAQYQKQFEELMVQLKDQQEVLNELQNQKKKLLTKLNAKQNYYEWVVKEYQGVSKSLKNLFTQFSEGVKSSASTQKSISALSLPVDEGKLVKKFGKQVHPTFGTVLFHKGIEIESAEGAPVYAILDGKVEFSGWLKGLGNVLIIQHANGLFTLSAHLFQPQPIQGDIVEKGDVIGYVGQSLFENKASLYFEVREKEAAFDPLRFFSTEALQNLAMK